MHLTDKTACELAGLIAARQLSAVELVRACLGRIDALNPRINAIVTLDAEAALERARRCDDLASSGRRLGRLHGLPVAVKDCFETAGLRTTYGSRLFADHVPDRDCLHVKRMREAGAVILGKTNIPEFCYGNQTANAVFGATRNPYNLTKTVGGSSGGAAAAAAARLAPLTDGSDMGGSIRTPAAFCNLVGVRPSAGRAPLYPNRVNFEAMLTVGPIARRVRDAALLLEVVTGDDWRVPRSGGPSIVGLHEDLESDPSGLRLGWCPAPAGADTHPRVVEVLTAALGVFEDLGCRVTAAAPDLTPAYRAQKVFMALATAADVGPLIAGNEAKVEAHVRARAGKASDLSPVDVLRAYRDRETAWANLVGFFKAHDFLLMPVNTMLAFDAELTEEEVAFDWHPVEVQPPLGVPCISIPGGFTPDGMPCGLQIVGRTGGDAALLRLAHAFEEATGHWRHAPDLPS